MKKSLAILRNSAFLAAVMLSAAPVSGAVIYDNLTTDDISQFYGRFETGQKEVGNQIFNSGLTTADRILSVFTLEYWATNAAGSLNGNVSVTLRLYDNNALNTSYPGYYLPGTLLGSGTKNITSSTGLGTLTFRVFQDFGIVDLPLTDDYTWTVQFGGLGANDRVGLGLHSPTTIGDNYGDIWYKDSGGNWQNVMTNDVNSFGAKIEAVPEPAAVWLLALAGLLGFGVVRRWKPAK